MKRLFSLAGLILASFLFAAPAAAQTFSNVTATVKDPLGNLYVNCTYSVDFVGQAVGATVPYTIGGTSPFQQSYAGAKCDSSAVMTIRIPSNTAISPTPSQWRFSICSSTGVTCFTYQGTISGSPVDLTAALQAVAANLPGNVFPSVSVTSLNNIRFVPLGASTLTSRVATTCADASGTSYLTAVIPSNEPSGTYALLNANCEILDLRSTGGFNEQGTYTTAFSKGWNQFLYWNDIQASPNLTYSGLAMLISNPSHGTNTGTGGSVYKANYRGLNVTMNVGAAGQHAAAEGVVNKYSVGDAIGLMGLCNGQNGIRTGVGDEGCIGVRTAVRQDTNLFTATIVTVDFPLNKSITFGSESNKYAAGAGTRWLLNLTRSVYNTGTATFSTSGGTAVTGAGTAWSGLSGSYCISVDADATNQGGMKYALPVTITSDTTLTLGFGYSTSGAAADGVAKAYHLYKCREVLDYIPETNTMTFAVPASTDFTINDNVELPTSPLWSAAAVKMEWGQRFLSSNSQTGFGIGHTCNSSWCVASNAIVVGGNFNSLLEWNSQTRQMGVAFTLANNSLGPNTIINLNESAAANGLNRSLVQWNRHTSIGGNFSIVFQRANPTDEIDFGGVQIFKFTPGSASGTRLFTVRTTGDIPIFQVDTNGPSAMFNNNSTVNGYSDNQSTNTWQITGGGIARFNNGVAVNAAGTVRWTSGAGAPGGGCVTGALYSNTTGGAGTTLYVCEAGAWAAK